MELKRRYTVMVFPQGFDGTILKVNIVLIPRNQNPFDTFPTGLAAPDASATAFADVIPKFEIAVIKGLDEWPISNASAAGRKPELIPVNVTAAVNKRELLKAIAADFGVKINADNTTDKAENIIPEDLSVYKYLPESYRDSFNFTSPRHKNARTDDSYHCAIKKDTKKKTWVNSDQLSWGQIFAHILRQPMLAKACGMIYEAEINVSANPGWFNKGSYIYADLVNTDYVKIQTELLKDADGPFIKRYAARIPKLVVATKRPVFAPLLFPVLFGNGGVDPEPPKAPWDRIFAEINEYNDGFSKIVHAAQPVSSNLLSEKQDGAHPVKDAGMRLAWDDEQILIWYIRQLSQNPDEPGKRLDVPMGVYGYRVDVKEQGAGVWNSLNLVRSKEAYTIGGASLGNNPDDELELPYQVFPSQPDNNTAGPYWLPMYFTNWIGKSLVLKDSDAALIYKNTEATESAVDPTLRNVSAGNMFDEVPVAAKLLYGKTYEFRVRMMDISGGGPVIGEEALNVAASPEAKRDFKRYIAPGLCRIEKPLDLKEVRTEFFNELIVAGVHEFDANPVLKIRRPVLNYPAVIFTGKYQAAGLDPVQLLIDSVDAQVGSKIPAIADPDVAKVEIKVEVETLRLDNLMSESGSENYITLYQTTRNFGAGFEDELELPVVFHDIKFLNLGNTLDPFNDVTLNQAAIDALIVIPLPTARKIRVTARAVCDGNNAAYYGFIDEGNHGLDSRYGKKTQFWFYKESGIEEDLLLPKANVANIKAIYLQPDPVAITEIKDLKVHYNLEVTERIPDMVKRLAEQLGVEAKGLTLVGKKGTRVVFGCNSKIRHHLSPDQSSITFSSKGDLSNHWIGCIVYRLNRDWSWDALQDVSFTIKRNKKFKHDSIAETETLEVLGDIELKHYASFESLIPDEFGNVDRSSTTLIFIDAIEPKSSRKQASGQLRFPDELEVDYVIKPVFKPGHGNEIEIIPEKLSLPATVIPSQVPKISSVGLAFSPYRKNEKYSATEPRQRYLWIELDEPVNDPHDTIFCRLLHYAPDQLISNNLGISGDDTQDPPLPIDPEYIRSITPNQTDDMAGLSAMQAMEKASGNDNIHYLLPLPPGLHAESAELFGFFTYEFRMGHGHWSNEEDGKENLWSTAQGRFGRPLRVTGMQHPAPTLLCTANRDKDKVYATAPYAKAVWSGKDVTPDPPRTQLHCVLYAQVKQADGLQFRNILLDEKMMILDKPPKAGRLAAESNQLFRTAQTELSNWTVKQTDEQARAGILLTHLSILNETSKLKFDPHTQRKIDQVIHERSIGKITNPDLETSRKILFAYKKLHEEIIIPAAPPVVAQNFTTASLVAGAKIAIFKEQVKTATVVWHTKEIAALLISIGLPEDSPLSVLAVEVFGNISSIYEHVGLSLPEIKNLTANTPQVYAAIESRQLKRQQALSGALGQYRILRTSPLTEVPFVCCPTCV